jgi:hypothetical protein
MTNTIPGRLAGRGDATGGDKIAYVPPSRPKEAVARVLKVAGVPGTGDAVSRLSGGQIEGLGMKDGEVRFAR